MLRLSKKAWALLLLVASPVLVPLLFVTGSGVMAGTYWLFGYYVNIPGWRMGEIAAKLNDVSACDDLRKTWYFGGFDSGDMHRSECIHTFARLTKDPSACELLMPTQYAWSCLGAAQAKGDACSINFGRDVTWAETPYTDIRKATLDECKRGTVTTEKGRGCCHILLLSSEKDVDDCSRFEGSEGFERNDSYLNLCLSQLAMKRRDESVCAKITDSNARTICELQAKYVGKTQ